MSWTLTVSSVVSGAALLSYALLLAFMVRNGLSRRTHRFFAAYLASMMLWSFGAVMMYADPADVVIWQKVLVAGTTLVPLTFYGFVRQFRGQRGPDQVFIVGSVVMVLMLVLNAYGYLFQDVTISQEGLIGLQFGPLMPAFGAYYLFFMVLSAVYLVGDFRRTQDFETRNRIKYVLVGITFIIIGSLTNLCLWERLFRWTSRRT